VPARTRARRLGAARVFKSVQTTLHFSVLLDLVAETMINTQVDGACGGAPV
jgi:hypothetical protein